MTADTDLTPPDAPMARLLSPLLMIGQCICVIFIVLLLLTVAFMIFPSEFRENLLSKAPTPISPTLMIWRALATAVILVGLFFILKFLRKIVTAVVHGDPFLPANIARLRYIWIILAVTEIFRMFIKLILSGTSDIEASVRQLDIRLGTWFIIFVIVVISEAFRHGAALRAEQELTI